MIELLILFGVVFGWLCVGACFDARRHRKNSEALRAARRNLEYPK